MVQSEQVISRLMAGGGQGGPSQAEARKPGLQHYMGLDMRNPDFVTCK